MAGGATELQQLLVRLVGDNKQYVKALKEADKSTAKFVRDSEGKFRTLSGKIVSAEEVIRQQVGMTMAKMQAYGQQLKKLGGQWKNAGAVAKRFGASLSLRVTAPLVAAGALAAKSFSGYEESLSRMVGLVGLSAEEVAKLSVSIKDIAKNTGKGPQELADAMFFITSAGLKGQAAIDALTASAKASAAGLGNVTSVADAVTSAMNAYGAGVLSASRATDILTAAVRKGKLDAATLAPVLGALLPTASKLGIAFEDVAGSIAVMSRTGLAANEAATSLSAIMTTLLKPTKQGEEALASVELKLADLRKIAAGPGGIIKVMRMLSEAFEGNDEAMVQVIPNITAFRGVMNVLAQDASIVDEVMGEVRDSVGLTDDAFKAGANTLERSWAVAMAKVKVAMIEMGEIVAPIFKAVANSIAGVVDWLSNLGPTTKTVLTVFLALAATLGPILLSLGMLVSLVGSVITGFGVLAASTTALTYTLIALKVAALAAGAAVAVGLAIGANQLGKEIFGINAMLDKTTEMISAQAESAAKRFTTGMAKINDMDYDGQINALKKMSSSSQGSLEAAKGNIREYQEELDKLNAQNWFSKWLDAPGIKMQEQNLQAAKDMAKLYEEQVESASEKLKELEGQTKVEGPDGEVHARGQEAQDEVDGLFDELNSQIANFGLEGVELAVAKLRAELLAQGSALTDEEENRLRVMHEQLTVLEDQKKAQDEKDAKWKKTLADIDADVKRMQREDAAAAKKIIEDQKTAQEKTEEQMKEVNRLRDLGLITAEQATEARKGIAKKGLEAQAKGEDSRARPVLKAMEAGTPEARQARRQAKEAAEARIAREKQVALLERTAVATESLAVDPAVPANLGI